MNKEFVTKKQAHALKELGFNELCMAADYYSDGEILIEYADEGITNTELDEITAECNEDAVENGDKLLDYDATIPLNQQAFRWFREKHKLIAYPQWRIDNTWDITIQQLDGYGLLSGQTTLSVIKKSIYEEAESACLDKLIEIIKNK